jgi:kynurenine formamidase
MSATSDASLLIHPDMLHGGPRPTVQQVFSIAAGDDYNVTRWTISAHAGTHVESPSHTVDGLATVAELPLTDLVGPARVLDLTAVVTEITAADLVAAGLGDDTRVLLRTTNSDTVLQQGDKADAWIGLAPDAAALLVERGVKVLGIDYLTFEAPAREATFDSHLILNGAGVALIESVDLRGVAAGIVGLTCLPLKLDAEAAPARVLIDDAALVEQEVLDISIVVREDMLIWGKPPERIVVESLAGGDMCNVTRWFIGTHTGTHLDAPLHYTDGQTTIDAIPLDAFAGDAQVLDLTALTTDITADDLLQAGLGDTPRVLLRTRNSLQRLLHGAERPDTWIGLTGDGARLLVERGVTLVGLDFLNIESSAESASRGWAAHHVLCDAGLAILECIDLLDVEAGDYVLRALPIPLQGAEAAPGRAILLRRAATG